MRLRTAAGLFAVLALCIFFLRIGAMHPTEEELCRAEALEYLLAQNDPGTLETLAPFLGGAADLRSAETLPLPGGDSLRVGERMLREDGRLYFIRAGCAQIVVFELEDGA